MNFLGVLRETQMYVRGLETGLTLFDLPDGSQDADLAQWQPVLNWLRPIARVEPVVAASVQAAEITVNVTPAPHKEDKRPIPFVRPQPVQQAPDSVLPVEPMLTFENFPVPASLLRH